MMTTPTPTSIGAIIKSYVEPHGYKFVDATQEFENLQPKVITGRIQKKKTTIFLLHRTAGTHRYFEHHGAFSKDSMMLVTYKSIITFDPTESIPTSKCIINHLTAEPGKCSKCNLKVDLEYLLPCRDCGLPICEGCCIRTVGRYEFKLSCCHCNYEIRNNIFKKNSQSAQIMEDRTISLDGNHVSLLIDPSFTAARGNNEGIDSLMRSAFPRVVTDIYHMSDKSELPSKVFLIPSMSRETYRKSPAANGNISAWGSPRDISSLYPKDEQFRTVSASQSENVWNYVAKRQKRKTRIPEFYIVYMDAIAKQSAVVSLFTIRMVGSNRLLMENDWRCYTCYKPLARRACSMCEIARYCDIVCQRKDWAHHKKQCMELRKHEIRGDIMFDIEK